MPNTKPYAISWPAKLEQMFDGHSATDGNGSGVDVVNLNYGEIYFTVDTH